MKAGTFLFQRPASLADAIAAAAAEPGAIKFLGGGQSMLPMMNLRVATPEKLAEICALPELRASHIADGRLFIGGAIRHAEIEDGVVGHPSLAYLQHVAKGIAYRSVRNRGTVAGSLAHADPAADWPTAMRAAGACVLIHGSNGRREIPLSEFQLGLMETALEPDEIVEGIWVPLLSANARWGYSKFCRKVGEFAHSIGAVVIDPDAGQSRVVLGAAGDTPTDLPAVAAWAADCLANSRPIDEAALTEVVAGAIRESLALDAYDSELHKTMVMRAVKGALK